MAQRWISAPDLSYTLIRLMEKLGWVWKVRLVSEEQKRQKLKAAGPE